MLRDCFTLLIILGLFSATGQAEPFKVRDYLSGIPSDYNFEFDTITGKTDVRLRFTPVQSVEHTPLVNSYIDPLTGRPHVEFFDHLPLRAESELIVGGQTYKLSCVRMRGGGMDDDSTPLQYVKFFLPTDDPDGSCVGPLNPKYPGLGEKRFRWNRYLVVTWDLENSSLISAELFIAGIDYDLRQVQ